MPLSLFHKSWTGLVLVGIAVASPVQAQEAPSGAGTEVQREAPSDAGQEVRLGSFIVGGGLTLSELYDDNIYATESAEVGDYVTIVTPELYLESDWERHRLRVEGGAEIGRYAGNDGEDYEDAWIGADGKYDISKDSKVFGGGRINREHEDRESPDDVNGTEPTTFARVQGHVGVAHKIERTSVRVGVTSERLDFEDVARTGGVINNDDRDRTMYEAGGRRVMR